MNFLEIFSKNTRISELMKIRPVGAEFRASGRTERQADRQTDMTKLIVAFRKFVKAPKNCSLLSELSAGMPKIPVPTTINTPKSAS